MRVQPTYSGQLSHSSPSALSPMLPLQPPGCHGVRTSTHLLQYGKRDNRRVTVGPTSGGTTNPSPPSGNLGSNFASPNRFAALESEYRPLCYVDVDFKAPGAEEWRTTRAMVDCGGQGSFINDKLSRDYQLPHRPKCLPVSIVLADGSSSQAGLITQYNPLILRVAGNEEPISMDVAPTAHNIILGMPWLDKHDPAVHFGSRTVTFDSEFCKKNCSHFGHTVPPHQSASIADGGHPAL